MPKSRRVSKSKSKTKSLWAKIAAIFAFLLVATFILTSSKSGSNVLGVSTTNFLGLGSKTTNSTSNTTTTCKPMISAISFSNPCTDKNGQPGFKSVTYTCVSGTKGSSTTNCLSPQQALDSAGKTCSKGSSSCKPPVQNGGQQQSQQGGQQQGGAQNGQRQGPPQDGQTQNSSSF